MMFYIVIVFIYSLVESICFQFKVLSTTIQHNYQIDKNFTLQNGPIYAKGWLKYLNYKVGDKLKPADLSKNSAFYEQMKNHKTVDLGKKDKIGFIKRNFDKIKHIVLKYFVYFIIFIK